MCALECAAVIGPARFAVRVAQRLLHIGNQVVDVRLMPQHIKPRERGLERGAGVHIAVIRLKPHPQPEVNINFLVVGQRTCEPIFINIGAVLAVDLGHRDAVIGQLAVRAHPERGCRVGRIAEQVFPAVLRIRKLQNLLLHTMQLRRDCLAPRFAALFTQRADYPLVNRFHDVVDRVERVEHRVHLVDDVLCGGELAFGRLPLLLDFHCAHTVRHILGKAVERRAGGAALKR